MGKVFFVNRLVMIAISTSLATVGAIKEFHPPILNLNQDSIDLPVASNFTIECEGKYPLRWRVPEKWAIEIMKRTKITERYDPSRKNPCMSIITVKHIRSIDTGYYSCYYKNTTDFEDRASITSIYLFANDPLFLFVQDINSGFTLFPTIKYGPEAVIPCKPTSSKVNVSLWMNNDDENRMVPFDKSVQFDPKRGIILKFPSPKFSGLFACHAQLGTAEYEISLFLLYFGDTARPPEPVIEKIGPGHAMVNGTYKLRCSTRASTEALIDIQFDYPAKYRPGAASRIIETGIKSENTNDPLGYTNVYSELTINPVVAADEGIYKCVSSDHTEKTGVTETYLKVFAEKPPAFVNLTTDLYDEVEMPIGTKNVRFVVKYFVYPSRKSVEFIWRKGNQLLDDERHNVLEIENSTQLILTISELKREDTGNYSLQAITEHITEYVTIKLLVTEKPKASIFKHQRYLLPRVKYKLVCGALGSPKPMIWWSWKGCDVIENCKSSDYSIVNETLYKYMMVNEFTGDYAKTFVTESYTTGSVLTVTAENSGYFICKARNRIGKFSSIAQQFIVSEATNGLDIVASKNDIIVLDSLTLSCRANVFEFSNVSWSWIPKNENSSNQQPLPDGTEQRHFNSSKYIILSRLYFKSIELYHSGRYICSASFHESSSEKKTSFIMKVRDMVPPTMNRTNMKDEVVVAERTEQFNFFCYAVGVPKPTVTWYKNDALFNISTMSGIVLEDEGQKLTINRLFNSDSGTYVCEVENRAGVLSASMTLSVQSDVLPKTANPTILGMVVGIVLVLVFLAIVGGCLVRKMYKDKKLKLDLELEGFKHFDQGRLDMYNPDLPLDDQAELLPYDKRWEFPKERLILGKTLGQGAFGRVVRAEAIGLSGYESSTTVAVKMLKEKSDKTQLKALVAELKIMIHLGKHLNVVNLLGAVTRNIARGELMVLVEFCKYGNLRHYLLHNRRNYIDQVSPDNDEIDINITSQSSVIGKNRKLSVTATENDQVEKQLHYADIVHAYKRGISREVSRTASHNDQNFDINSEGTYSPTSKGHPPMRSGSNASSSLKHNNSSMHKAVLGRSASGGPDIHHRQGSSTSSGAPDECFSDFSGSGGDVFSSSGMNRYKGSIKDAPVTTCDLLCFSFQIARGMEYLSSKKLIHRDLAARNILLAEDNVVKICDFGLAKDCYKYSNYVKKGDGPLPIKWMAIESIRDKVFTTQTDVWSFAILLWEVFTIGGNPYPGIEVDEEFFKKLKNGYRMEKPEFCPKSVFKLVEDCWEAEPHDRPNFTEVAERLGDLLEGSMKKYYIELNNPFVLMNEEMQNNNDYLTMEGKDRDSNYLNMAGAKQDNRISTSEDHYDNIKNVRPVGVAKGEEVILRPPMEIVPMIQFNDDKNSYSREGHADRQGKGTVEEKSPPPLTDYIYMGSPKKKEFPDHPFAIESAKESSNENPPTYQDAMGDVKFTTEVQFV